LSQHIGQIVTFDMGIPLFNFLILGESMNSRLWNLASTD